MYYSANKHRLKNSISKQSNTLLSSVTYPDIFCMVGWKRSLVSELPYGQIYMSNQWLGSTHSETTGASIRTVEIRKKFQELKHDIRNFNHHSKIIS